MCLRQSKGSRIDQTFRPGSGKSYTPGNGKRLPHGGTEPAVRVKVGGGGGACLREEGLRGTPGSGFIGTMPSAPRDLLHKVSSLVSRELAMGGSGFGCDLEGETRRDASMELCVQISMLSKSPGFQATHFASCCSLHRFVYQGSRQQAPRIQGRLCQSVPPPWLIMRLVAGEPKEPIQQQRTYLALRPELSLSFPRVSWS